MGRLLRKEKSLKKGMLQGLMIIMMLITVLYTGLWMSFYNTAWLLAYNQLTRPVDPAPVDAEPPQIQG